MSNITEARLRQLCSQSDTIKKARSIFHYASAKTGRGSGHDIGSCATGLPAICAYIASQELCNGDVSKEAAQKSSCLHPVNFNKTLTTVQLVLAEMNDFKGKGRMTSVKVTYKSLIRDIRIPAQRSGARDPLSRWMEEVEEALVQSNDSVDREDPHVKCAVFLWTCACVGQTDTADIRDDLTRKYAVPMNLLRKLNSDLNRACTDVRTRIKLELSALKKGSSSPMKSSPTRSPLKLTTQVRTSPTKASLQKRKAVITNPSTNDEMSEDDDADLPKTPSKKRRLEPDSSHKPIPKPVFLSSPLKARASPSKANLTLRELPGKRVPVVSVSSPPKSPGLEINAPNPDADTTDIVPDHQDELVAEPIHVTGPSTPRRSQRTQNIHTLSLSRPIPSTQVQAADDDSMDIDPLTSSNDEHLETAPPRRFRPVFLDHNQWTQRDPRMDQTWTRYDNRNGAVGGAG